MSKPKYEIPRHCRYGHPVDPLTGRCGSGHVLYVPLEADWTKARVGFFDIETNGNQDADFGYVYCWFIKVRGKKKFYSACVTKEDIEKEDFDKRVLTELTEAFKHFDVIVTYNGNWFDIPYVRTRCFANGQPFPFYGDLYHWDLFQIARAQLKLGRRWPSMEKVANLLGIKGKNHVEPRIWRRAQTGSAEALGYILDHNKRDVVVLEQVFERFEGYFRRAKKSI